MEPVSVIAGERTPEIAWKPAPENLELPEDELLVFGTSLELSEARLASLTLALSEDELARAARFRFAKDRRCFVASRGLLRELVGGLLHVKPGSLTFRYTARGKPRLADFVNRQRLHFNVSHAESLAVYAVTRNHEVGIDLERLRPVKGAEAIAGRFFSEREFAQWRSVPLHYRVEAFFNCWTRKEACLKATGDGIGELLSQVEVSLLPGEPVRLLSMAGSSGAAAHWLLHSLTPSPAYLGAVAVPQGTHLRINCWRW